MKLICFVFSVLALAFFSGCSSSEHSHQQAQGEIARDGASVSTGSGGAVGGGGSATR